MDKNKDDIGIEHNDGYTKITNVPIEKIKSFRNQAQGSSIKRGEIGFSGVKKIDILKPDGKPDKTIYSDNLENK